MKAMHRPLILSGTLILISLLALGQSVPQLIAYQGRITNASGLPLDGTSVDLTFTFYPTEISATPLLTVTQPTVPVSKGIYNVLVGSGGILPGAETTLAEVFQNHAEVWMGVQVNTDPEMTPRARISSVGFALKAEKAEKADRVDTRWLTAFILSNDYDQDGYPKNNDCDDGNAFVGPPSLQKLGTDLRLTNDANPASWTSLAWTGSEFGLSWNDYPYYLSWYGVRFARISPSGEKLGSDLLIFYYQPIPDIYYHTISSLIWTGYNFGIGFMDTPLGNNNISLFTFSPSGEISDYIEVEKDITDSSAPSIAWTGSEFGVSWTDYQNTPPFGSWKISFARTSSFNKIEVAQLGFMADSSLAWTGSEFGIFSTYSGSGILFTRVSSSGEKIGDNILVSNASPEFAPSLAWTGSEFGISWNYGGTFFARVSSSGEKIGNDLLVSSQGVNNDKPSLVWTGSEFGVSWAAGWQEIYLARVSSAGSKLGSDFRVASYTELTQHPSLAWTGSEFGLSWNHNGDINSGIYFARIGVCP